MLCAKKKVPSTKTTQTMAHPVKMSRALLVLLGLHLLAARSAATSSSSSSSPPLTSAAATAAAERSPPRPSLAAAAPAQKNNDPFCFPGTECPRYDLLEVASAGYQVRKYEPATWALTVVRHAPSLQAAQLVGLARLGRYWTHNDRGRALQITSPLVTALFPTKKADASDDWSVKGVFVVAAPLPRSDAHYPPKSDSDVCPWGDPDARRGEGCRVRVFRSGVEGGCRRRRNDDEDEKAWLADAVETMMREEEEDQGDDGSDSAETMDDPPCFLDGPNGDCSDEEDDDHDDDLPSSSQQDQDPNRRRRPRRRRDKGTVLYAAPPFDGFPTERDALQRARELRLALHADRRPYCRRVFFLSVYSPAWQLILRRNEIWVPSCARGHGNDGGGAEAGAGVAPF
jgi:hypothetical protein